MSNTHNKDNPKQKQSIEMIEPAMQPRSHPDEDTHAPRKNNADDSTSSDTNAIAGTFPEKLMFILDNEDVYGNTAAWLPDGKSFVIRSPQRFSDEVLPHIFRRGCKFNSFTRKLYYWGFKKKKSKGQGSAAVEFHHENFCRGSAPSCMHLRALQKSFQRNNNTKSPAESKIEFYLDSVDSDRSVSPLLLEETKSSAMDMNSTQKLRMVRAAVVNYGHQKSTEVISSSRKGHPDSPQMAVHSPDQLPLPERTQISNLNFCSLPSVNNCSCPPAGDRDGIIKLHSNAHHLGDELKRRKLQSPFQTSRSVKAFCHSNNMRALLGTYPLSLAPFQGATTTSLLAGLNALPIPHQQNLANLSPYLASVSALQSLQRM